ncbi:MAG: TPM domain-containing protein [Bacteroidota bacterium]|jgi:uncharacterized protein
MKKKLYFLFLISCLLTISCSKSTQQKKRNFFIFDTEKILTIEQSKQLDSLFREHEKRTTNEIVILTTPDYGHFKNIVDFSVDFGEKQGIGKKEYDNGVVIVFSKAKKEIRISTGYGTAEVLNDKIAYKIIDSLMTPKFKSELYFEGLRDGSIAIVSFLDKPENKIKLRPKKK